MYYDRVGISKRFDPTKSNNNKECIICHSRFFYYGFKFQDSICNICHDLTTFCLNISDITIITVKNIDYRCIIGNISKSEANNLLKKLCTWKLGVYINNTPLIFSLLFLNFFCFSIYKIFDSECSTNIYKSLKIRIAAVM